VGEYLDKVRHIWEKKARKMQTENEQIILEERNAEVDMSR
jgi:hypothetical protein